MKKHLVLIAALFAIILTAPSVFAQDTTAPTAPAATGKAAKSPDAQLADLTAKLNLTTDQQAKIGDLLSDQAKQFKKNKKSAATPEDAKAGAKNIRQETNDKIRALLTPDQQTIFDADQKAGKHHAKKAKE